MWMHGPYPLRSVTNILPGACVMHSGKRLFWATHCGVTPHAQKMGTSSSSMLTASP